MASSSRAVPTGKEHELTQKEKEICKKYSARDENGLVHCKECPLVVDSDGFMCKANSRYNRKTKEWERSDNHDGE